ncbi:SWI/SNF chromatin remodeling complex protein [Chloropicon primus]|nr:SWI/SNF chromatin remodeling complex protein [Chloropicon primus]
MSEVLKSPLLAILQARRARERTAAKGLEAVGKENGGEEGRGAASRMDKPFAPRAKKKASEAAKEGERVESVSLSTPPDFTPRRRRLRKIGKDALRKFQQKRTEGAAGSTSSLMQTLRYEDEDAEDAEGKAAGVPLDESGEKVGGIQIDDVLESFGGLGLGEGGSRKKPPASQGSEAKRPAGRQYADKTERISAEIEARGSRSEAREETRGTLLELKGGYQLKLNFSLYPHQEEGISWLWKLHRMKKGGILADDMGLGKTMQISAFLSGLFLKRMTKRALIVAPKTLLKHWAKELTKCGLGNFICEFYGGSANSRRSDLERSLQEGGIVLTTYGMILHNDAELKGLGKISCIDSDDEHQQATWDYMILDEGHKLKNPKIQLYQKLKRFQVRNRVILTGTPVQNNMQELHALMEFVCEGILGDRRDFREDFERPIINGLDKEATHRDREVGKATSAKLQTIISKYILRREKDKVFKKDKKEEEEASTSPEAGGAAEVLPSLENVRKNDLVVWLKMNRQQQNLYMSFLQTESVFRALNNTGSALAALSVLKKICDHTDLITNNAANQISTQIKVPSSGDDDSAAGGRDEDQSCKIDFLLQLLPELHSKGHRTLVFSQSRQMLDRVQKAVEGLELAFCRIDGSISSIERRQEEVDRFKRNDEIPVFLLTTGVGGLGLTLTEANRVVVVDPAWNPSVDNQSVDRAYRIGQTRNVVVYRLITCGTVEEKIYRKQVFKQGLSIISNGGEEAFRYFTKQELRELFSASYEGFLNSKTQLELEKKHGGERKSDEGLDDHIAFLKRLEGYFGTSDHDLLFTKAPDEATFQAPMMRKLGPGGSLKFSSGGVPQSPLAKKMQSRSQWGGAGLLSHLTLDDEEDKPEAGPSSSVADSRTVARVDCVDINSLTASSEEASKAKKEIQSLRDDISRAENLLRNSGLLARLPDGGAQLKQKQEDRKKKLDSLLSSQGGDRTSSPTTSYNMYLEAYKSSYNHALQENNNQQDDGVP